MYNSKSAHFKISVQQCTILKELISNGVQIQKVLLSNNKCKVMIPLLKTSQKHISTLACASAHTYTHTRARAHTRTHEASTCDICRRSSLARAWLCGNGSGLSPWSSPPIPANERGSNWSLTESHTPLPTDHLQASGYDESLIASLQYGQRRQEYETEGRLPNVSCFALQVWKPFLLTRLPS